MLSIAVCDDEVIECCNIARKIKDILEEMKIPCIIRQFQSGRELLQAMESFDIVFLDIMMQDQDGMKTAKMLRERENEKILIFVSSSREYVFEAYDVEAFQYLLKPVNEEKFAQVFARAVKQIMSNRENPQRGRALTLQSASTSKTVPLDSIYYIESSDHKVVLHLRDGKFAYYAKIRDLEMELQNQFFRIHKGYLVNLSYVAGYSKTEVTLTNGEKLLLSKYKYQDFVKAYLHFLKEGAGL